MTKVTSNPAGITVTYAPTDSVATGAQLSWDNPELLKALRKVFNCEMHNDQIVELQVDHYGIRASFKR